MDRIKLLQTRRTQLLDCGKAIRKKIADLVDESSFVELDSYSFSRNEFYGENAEGEGVVTGYATVNGYPVCIVAQNSAVLSGGLSLASCKKIVKCMQKALESDFAMLYLLDGKGVQVGEGVNVLEGIGEVLDASSALRDAGVPQISVVVGEVYGSMAILGANSDYSYLLKGGCMSYASPLVISASENKNIDKEAVGGAKSCQNNGNYTAEVKDIASLKNEITKLFDNLASDNQNADEVNKACAALNKKVNATTIIDAAFDKGSFIEINKAFAPQVKTGIGFIGDTSVASIVFDGEEGVELTSCVMQKLNDFVKFANRNNYTIVTFVNTLGIKQDAKTNSSSILKQIGEFIDNYKYSRKISVITGYAVGLGYTLFASKALNNKYSYAFATAQVGLYNEKVGAVVELDAGANDIEEIAEKYKDNMDPINAARNGYIDNIIEPKYVRQYLVSALQTLEV